MSGEPKAEKQALERPLDGGLGVITTATSMAEGLQIAERPAIILPDVAGRLSHDDNG